MEKQEESVLKSPFKALNQQTRPEVTKVAPTSASGINLSAFTLTELMQLREDIHSRLPPQRLSEMNLESELVLQYQQAKALLNSVISDNNVPTNQKAQTSNSVAALLEQLSKLQNSLYNSERVKALEIALVQTIRGLPESDQRTFFSTYESTYAAARGER